MWFTLLLAVLVGIAALYAPGYLIARSFSVSRFASVALAPALSIFVAVVLGIVLEKLGITCTGYFLFALMISLCLIIFLASEGLARIRGDRHQHRLIPMENPKETWKVAGLYMVVALGIAIVVYFLAIDGPESFSRNDDTTFHLGAVRAFLDTGTFSALNVSAYLDQGYVGGFYPAAWHVTTAMIASFFGNNVTLAANASVALFLVFVFPLALCLLFTRLFENNKRAIWAGSLFVLAFGGFPWGFIVFGQLFSNMVSFILVPLALTLLIEAIEAERHSDKVKLAFLMGVALVSIALAQPNGAFTFGIWAVLYCINRMFYPPNAEKATLTKKRAAAAATLLLIACAVWVVLYFAPFMQTITQHIWKAVNSPAEAIALSLLFMFTGRGGVQPFLSIVVLLGLIYTVRNRRYLWLTCAFAFAMVAFILDATADGFVKQLLTGFWYTDRYRTAAMAAFLAIPLASLGFVQLVDLVKMGASKTLKKEPSKYFAPAIAVALFAVCQFLPAHVKVTEKVDVYSGLVKIHKEVTARYSWNSILTSEEDVFVKKVMETVPEGALLINVPSDGSCWSYGVEGAGTYFKRSTDNGLAGVKDSEILRTQLCDINTSEEVREVVNKLDARYVLMLDDPTGEHRTTTSFRYKPENWEGIESITEQTPGFTLILSEGDMRLYEID